MCCAGTEIARFLGSRGLRPLGFSAAHGRIDCLMPSSIVVR